jgi:hypothetical protein
MLKQFILFAQEHPMLIVGAITAAGTWLFNNVFTAAIAAMPAPTKDSTPKYTFWFKFLNSIVGNYLRAHHAEVESSPNWQDAFNKRVALIEGLRNGIMPSGKDLMDGFQKGIIPKEGPSA